MASASKKEQHGCKTNEQSSEPGISVQIALPPFSIPHGNTDRRYKQKPSTALLL
jgi:hypothetical protein